MKIADHVEHGGFSRAVGADETEGFPLFHLKTDIVDGGQASNENENIVLVTAYSSILASLIANSIIIEYAVVSAKIELKSVTAQRITFVFSLIAHDLAKCILKNDLPPKTFFDNLTNLLPSLICPN